MSPRVLRTYEATRTAEPLRVHIHQHDCRCRVCDPHQQLTRREIAWLTLGGVLVGNAIMFAVDPAGSATTLGAAVRHLLGIPS